MAVIVVTKRDSPCRRAAVHVSELSSSRVAVLTSYYRSRPNLKNTEKNFSQSEKLNMRRKDSVQISDLAQYSSTRTCML